MRLNAETKHYVGRTRQRLQCERGCKGRARVDRRPRGVWAGHIADAGHGRGRVVHLRRDRFYAGCPARSAVSAPTGLARAGSRPAWAVSPASPQRRRAGWPIPCLRNGQVRGKPSVPAARHTSPTSRVSSTRSRATMAAGTDRPWNGLEGTRPRFCDRVRHARGNIAPSRPGLHQLLGSLLITFQLMRSGLIWSSRWH
jgi:hypothetical protein